MEPQKPANLIRDSPTQFLWFAAGPDRLTGASHGFMSVGLAFLREDAFRIFLECDTR